MKERLALVTNIPAPYRIDLFRRLCSSPSFDAKIFFLARSEPNRYWRMASTLDFPHEFSRSLTLPRPIGAGVLHICYGLLWALARFHPSVVIVGGASLAAWISVVIARCTGARVYVWWAGTHYSELTRGRMTIALRKLLFKSVNGFFAYGVESERYLCERCRVAPKDIIVLGNNTLDVKKYGSSVLEHRRQIKWESKPFTILVAAQLIKRKNIETAIEAFYLFTQRHKGASVLLIAGVGPEQERLKMLCAEKRLETVTFLGDLEPEVLKTVYQNADVVLSIALVDQFPQVVNEAMACGLPLIVSSTSGVDPECVRNGVNGFIVHPTESIAIAEHLREMAEDRNWCATLGLVSREIAERTDLSSVLEKLSRVIERSHV